MSGGAEKLFTKILYLSDLWEIFSESMSGIGISMDIRARPKGKTDYIHPDSE